jgi:hypothetical protein
MKARLRADVMPRAPTPSTVGDRYHTFLKRTGRPPRGSPSVYQPLQLGDRLGLRDQGDDHGDDRVGGEGHHGAVEGGLELRAEGDDLPLVGEVGRRGSERAGDQARQPAHGVIRFQNIPMMNVANRGALKKENSSWM